MAEPEHSGSGDFSRVVGKRVERAITLNASGDALHEGALFNDEIHKFCATTMTGMKKGIYRFATHEEANEHADASVTRAMAAVAISRLK